MPSCFPALVWARISFLARALYRISTIKVDFPEPDTPVMQTNSPRGILTSIFLRLFSVAPLIFRNLPLPCRRSLGRGTIFLPERYAPVIDFGSASISSGVPSATNQPPCSPAPGPRSTIQSALRIVSSSCSTTRTVLPRSRRPLRVSKSLSLSRGCRPIEGSSSTYKTPINLEPI